MAGVAGVLLIVIGWFVAGELRGEGSPNPEPSEAGSAENLIFVYGSAMPGQWGYDVIDRFVESSTRDEVDGSLYDSGLGYPMAKFDLGGSIPGFLITLDEATLDDAMRALTQFESGLFHPVEVRTRSGATALAYEWIGSTEGYPRIDFWDESLAGNFGVSFWVHTLSVGDCFSPDSIPGAGLLVKCTAPHQFSIYHVVDLSDGPFPGRDSLWQSAESECGNAFEAQFGRALNPELDPWYLPTSSQWEDGNYGFVCAMRASS